MDIVGSVAKFSRRESGEEGGRARCVAAEKEGQSPKDKEESFGAAPPHAIHCEALKERRSSLYWRNLQVFKASTERASTLRRRDDLPILRVNARVYRRSACLSYAPLVAEER